MQALTTPLLAQACRIFLAAAYPDGPDSVPVKKRPYQQISADQPLESLLPPAACAQGVCQPLRNDAGAPCGFEFRLGSKHFPHLKLRVQLIPHNSQPTLVFMVDTHDAFSREHRLPPVDHPEAEQWLALQNT